MNLKNILGSYIKEHKKTVVIVLVATVLFGARYAYVIWRSSAPNPLDAYVGEQITFEGLITEEQDRRENSTKLTVDIGLVTEFGDDEAGSSLLPESLDESAELGKNTRVLITAERYSDWRYGDKVLISGKLQEPENFVGNTGREFDYVSYLGKDNISYQMIYPRMSLLQRGEGNPVKEVLLAIKYAFMGRIESMIPEPESGLMGGLLLGAKHGLGKDILEDFQKSGVIHIVVLSGYNIAIVAEFIMWSLSFLPRMFGLGFGAFGIILFVGMTGAGASTIRAASMALIVVLSKALGRTYEASRALYIAGFAMLMHNPKILLHDPSFQLSFMATFGLIYVSPILEKKIPFARFLPEKFKIREMVMSTVTTQVFLLPFLLYQTGMLSIVAVPVNLLILAFIPFTMLMGFITGVVGMLSTILALPFAFLAHIVLSYIINTAQFFAKLPFAVFTVMAFPFWLVAAAYVFYFYYLLRFYTNKP